ncbi:hypothetical protein ENBRE01_1165 [Enteropsectra breve]|nr:hypothetical protein ENBRE01_1165 [Enteropsectra breve]
MVENIEKDRRALRENKDGENADYFSYLPYLLKKKKKEDTRRIKLHSMGTLNIIYYVEESFKLTDKYILKNLEKFKSELLTRSDLFVSIMSFVEREKVKDQLFYWLPGYKIDNVFSFLADVMPDFPSLYKNYLIHWRMNDEKLHDCFTFIKERYSQEYDSIRIIKRDLELFRSCITKDYWIEEPLDYNDEFVEIPGKMEINDAMEGRLIPELSFADVVIGTRQIRVSIYNLLGLLQEKDETKEYWISEGIIDAEWNIVA